MDYLVRNQRYSVCTVNLIYIINLCGCFGRKHTDDRCLLQPHVAECRGQSTIRLADVKAGLKLNVLMRLRACVYSVVPVPAYSICSLPDLS